MIDDYLQNHRKPYVSPLLTRFGNVAELTQSGSGPSESAGGSMSGMTCEGNSMPNPQCN